MPVAAPREAGDGQPARASGKLRCASSLSLCMRWAPVAIEPDDLSTSYPGMRTQASPTSGRYAEAGVDIDAGAELVDQIAPMARATARVGAMAALGGFGGLFDLAACGFRDPMLVATTDGVGTKVLLAAEAQAPSCGRHRPGRHVRQRPGGAGRPAVVLSRLFRHRAPRCPPWRGQVVAGIGEGCRHGRLRADRWRDRRDAGPIWSRRVRSCRFRRGCRRARRRCCHDLTGSPTVTWCWASPPRAFTPTASHWYDWSCASRGWVSTTACPWDASRQLGPAAAGADAHLRRELPRRHRRRRRQGPGPHHRRRPRRKPPARAGRWPGHASGCQDLGAAGGVRVAGQSRQARRAGADADLQLRHRHDARGRPRQGRRGALARCRPPASPYTRSAR